MVSEKVLEEIIRDVLKSLGHSEEGPASRDNGPASRDKADGKLKGAPRLTADKDYPLAVRRPELVKTPSGRPLKDITMDRVLGGEIKAEEFRITPETLKMQAEIAESVGRVQFARNLRRAAELTSVPDERILEIYNALRPYRSTRAELLAIADELENKYRATVNAAFVREAAEVYSRRNRLKQA